MLPRLSAVGVQQFIDSLTFSESAVDNIPLENRVEIVNRALRFARQQDAALKKKGITETQEERFVDKTVVGDAWHLVENDWNDTGRYKYRKVSQLYIVYAR